MKITTDYCEFNFTFADLLEKGFHGGSYTRSLMPDALYLNPACPVECSSAALPQEDSTGEPQPFAP
jgi:hypothetical protein